ncbi:glycosyltransferase [Pseudarthrobacter sp. J47]|uniref:glycosyltransferase n=1 Tax=Pseudarthrobacter sp. J47 TaxID=3116482 RepID=UPI002E81D9E7|nr:glycosyltransferase [Pseudarthrobacter sp. J47]
MPQAENSRLLKYWLTRSLQRANGIQYDAPIDYRRALKYGLPDGVPELYAAGNFGIDTDLFPPSAERIPGHIVFPRGRAESANGAGFVRAVELLKHHSQLRFTAIGLKGISYAEKAASDPMLTNRLVLTPRLSREAFAEVLATADVVVSPTFTDGTPNSILEALACGVTVVAGNIPSIANLQSEVGVMTLFEHGSDEEVAAAILGSVGRPPTVVRLPEHYSIHSNQARVLDFYDGAIRHHSGPNKVGDEMDQSRA